MLQHTHDHVDPARMLKAIGPVVPMLLSICVEQQFTIYGLQDRVDEIAD